MEKIMKIWSTQRNTIKALEAYIILVDPVDNDGEFLAAQARYQQEVDAWTHVSLRPGVSNNDFQAERGRYFAAQKAYIKAMVILLANSAIFEIGNETEFYGD
jgi:hypothetical protein